MCCPVPYVVYSYSTFKICASGASGEFNRVFIARTSQDVNFDTWRKRVKTKKITKLTKRDNLPISASVLTAALCCAYGAVLFATVPRWRGLAPATSGSVCSRSSGGQRHQGIQGMDRMLFARTQVRYSAAVELLLYTLVACCVDCF